MPCSRPDQITIDHTALYIIYHDIVDEIYKFNKKMKFVFVVRDPVERSISHFHMFKKEGLYKHSTFEDLVCSNKQDTSHVTKASLYGEHLEYWFKKFPREQFLIVHSDDLRYSPYEVMLNVENFLNLEHKVHEDNFQYNATRGFYCFNYDGQSHCLRKRKGREHPTVTEECITKLKTFYEPINQKFYELVERNFGW